MDELDDKQLEKISAGKQGQIIEGGTTTIDVEVDKISCARCHRSIRETWTRHWAPSSAIIQNLCYEKVYFLRGAAYCKDCYDKIKE